MTRNSNARPLLTTITLAVLFCQNIPAHSQDQSKSAPIEGKVVNLELGNVRDILLDVERAQKAASNLFDEVTRHPITTTMSANVIGATVISMPQPTFDVSQTLPARKAWVDTYMSEIKPIIIYMKQDLDAIRSGESALQMAEKDEKVLKPLLADWAAAIDKGAAATDELTKLTVGPTYDNSGIAKQAIELHKAMKTIKKNGKKVLDILRKSAKKDK
ncbi:MAG: hypothetical protein P4L53_24380 [Candidatus Obscuribacterales bacterium]|nr:hypothetical protein [Candidatus Obscuribacterales bacterium]